jgi:hypothetical protein
MLAKKLVQIIAANKSETLDKVGHEQIVAKLMIPMRSRMKKLELFQVTH